MVGAVSEVCFVICVRGAVGANLEDFFFRYAGVA